MVRGTLALKREPEKFRQHFHYQNALLMFAKPSLRTRVSFEAGMTEMGGTHLSIYLTLFRASLFLFSLELVSIQLFSD